MRCFSDTEKELLTFIINDFRDNKLDNLQVSKILVESILLKSYPVVAISWKKHPDEQITIYYKGNKTITTEESCSFLVPIADFIYFIRELESNNCIKLISMSSSSKGSNDNLLYDRNLYKFENKSFYKKDTIIVKDPLRDGNWLCNSLIIPSSSAFYLDIAKDLEYLSDKIIYPLPFLRDYVTHNYKTSDERYQRNTVIISLVAVAISLLSTLVAIFK